MINLLGAIGPIAKIALGVVDKSVGDKDLKEKLKAEISQQLLTNDSNQYRINQMYEEDLYTYKSLLKEAQQIKDAWNYDGLLIDPYNSLAKDAAILKMVGNAHEYDYQVLSELRIFTKKNNVQICVNAHGVTSALRQVHHSGHEYEGLTRPLAMSDAEGGSKISSRADDIWCIHRYVQSPTDWMYSHIHVLKIKENETGARPTSFEQPLRLRMKINNVGFEYMGRDLMHNQTKIEKLKI